MRYAVYVGIGILIYFFENMTQYCLGNIAQEHCALMVICGWYARIIQAHPWVNAYLSQFIYGIMGGIVGVLETYYVNKN